MWEASYEIILGEYVMVGELEGFSLELSDVNNALYPMWEAAYEIIHGEYVVVGEFEDLFN
jgi:hypothetical protein